MFQANNSRLVSRNGGRYTALSSCFPVIVRRRAPPGPGRTKSHRRRRPLRANDRFWGHRHRRGQAAVMGRSLRWDGRLSDSWTPPVRRHAIRSSAWWHVLWTTIMYLHTHRTISFSVISVRFGFNNKWRRRGGFIRKLPGCGCRGALFIGFSWQRTAWNRNQRLGRTQWRQEYETS